MVTCSPRHRHPLRVFALCLAFLPAVPQRALSQDTPKILPVTEINRILTDPSRTTPETVRFSGTVVFVSRVGDLNIQDGAAGIMVEPPADRPAARPGDRVEVTTSVAYQTADLLSPSFFLKAAGLRIMGPGELPRAEQVSLASALQGAAAGRRVQVEGVVMQATVDNGVVMLHLTDQSGWAVVNVHDWRSGTTTRDWWGARLKILGANVGRGHSALRVTSSDDITVIKPGTAEWFAAPPADPVALRASGPTADRLRLSATVLKAGSDEIYLRSDAGLPLRSSLLAPYPPTTPHPHPLELLAPRKPAALKPGDRVELVGSPLSITPAFQMSFASLRVLEHGSPALPVAVGTKNPSDFVSDFVTLSGRVRWHDEGSNARLALDCNGTTVHVLLPSGATDAESLQPGDMINATGLLLPGENGRPLSLEAADGRSITRLPDSPSSSWRSLTPVARRWITALAAGLGVALAGTWWLQRLVRQRTGDLANANEALKAEVAIRVKAETGLARALQQERELGELKSRFVSMVSHEFRTPLGITMSAVELLQHYHDRLPPEQRTVLLGDIQRSTRNMADLMEQVLLLGRVEAGRLGFRPQPLDLDSLARKLTDETLSATHRRCPIAWTCQGDLSGAWGDESLLRHIVSNLLSNAVKYSPPDAEVLLSAVRENSDVILTVRDSGIGIPPGEKDRMFEAFHRCTNVGEIPGTGLGLVIVKRCVDLHGGTIDFQSEPGRGTTFVVSLPLWPEAGTAPPAAPDGLTLDSRPAKPPGAGLAIHG